MLVVILVTTAVAALVWFAVLARVRGRQMEHRIRQELGRGRSAAQGR